MSTQTGWTTNAAFEEQIDIAARPGRIFAILDDPNNVPLLIPEISNVERSGNDVYKAVYTVKVLGLVPLNFSLTYNVASDRYPEQATLYFHGNVEGMIRWMLTSNGNNTHVIAHADYKFARQIIDDVLKNNVPNAGPLGGFLKGAADIAGGASSQLDLVLESLLTKSRDDVRQALTNLKARSEGL